LIVYPELEKLIIAAFDARVETAMARELSAGLRGD